MINNRNNNCDKYTPEKLYIQTLSKQVGVLVLCCIFWSINLGSLFPHFWSLDDIINYWK